MTTFYRSSDIPPQGAKTLPGNYYTGPDIFAEEYVIIDQIRFILGGPWQ